VLPTSSGRSPSAAAEMQPLGPSLQEHADLPRDLSKLFADSLFRLDMSMVPQVISSCLPGLLASVCVAGCPVWILSSFTPLILHWAYSCFSPSTPSL
jgi:hypothetical protein